ncbi:MAG: RtcB family protein [Chloroflexi bacterium]|nr:RtcB family protein [Chloroflexota bacterium]
MRVVFDRTRQLVPIKSWATAVDEGTLQQALNLANLPFAFNHIALLPDAHHGYGMPIGGVLPAQGYVVPNAIGVDIGCGMHARRTNIEAGRLTARAGGQTSLLRTVLDTIQAVVPSGNGPIGNHKALQRWDDPLADPDTVALLHSGPRALREAWARSGMQLGTLGGGNHFIEVQANEQLMLAAAEHELLLTAGSSATDSLIKGRTRL